MAEDTFYFLPGGLFELSDLHPDQLAKYTIGGDPSDFEKFLTYGATAVSLIGLARIKGWLGLGQGEQEEGDFKILPKQIYELAELWEPFRTGGGHHSEDIFTRANADDRVNLWLTETTARVNSVLDERSFLDFEFPNPKIGTRRVAMFENPEITESRSPSYAKQQIMQRNEPARLYVGAEARKVSLRFNCTLPLIEEYLYKAFNKPVGWNSITGAMGFGGPGILFLTTKTKYLEWISKSLSMQFNGTPDSTNPQAFKAGLADSGDTWQLVPNPIQGPQVWEGLEAIQEGMSTPVQAGGPFPAALNSWSIDNDTMAGPLMEAVAYIHFVLDTIRTSVIGDKEEFNQSKVWGPPIVKFRHGTIFEQDPWVVTSYNINYDNKAGMEPRTLLPRQLRITLELEEYHQTTGAQHGEQNAPLPGASDILDLESDHRHAMGEGRVIRYGG